jgi:hypothetical protein
METTQSVNHGRCHLQWFCHMLESIGKQGRWLHPSRVDRLSQDSQMEIVERLERCWRKRFCLDLFAFKRSTAWGLAEPLELKSYEDMLSNMLCSFARFQHTSPQELCNSSPEFHDLSGSRIPAMSYAPYVQTDCSSRCISSLTSTWKR